MNKNGLNRNSGKYTIRSKESIKSFFNGTVTLSFLAIIWILFIVQIFIPQGLQTTLFHFTTESPLNAWTWVTSIFTHGGFNHALFNSITIAFFGMIAEKRMGSKKYALFFIVAGIVAGLVHVGTLILMSTPGGVIGASGAGLAIIGLLTGWNHNFSFNMFGITIPIWIITVIYTFITAIYIIIAQLYIGSISGSGIAHVAHLSGITFGYIVGRYTDIYLPNNVNDLFT